MTTGISFILIVTLYTALGQEFDRAPQVIATFPDEQSCKAEASRIEARSGHGNEYIATCRPTTFEDRCTASPFMCGFYAFFGKRI